MINTYNAKMSTTRIIDSVLWMDNYHKDNYNDKNRWFCVMDNNNDSDNYNGKEH